MTAPMEPANLQSSEARPLQLGKTPLDKPSIAELTYRKLVDLIVTLQLPPGATVTEINLCRHLNVGRTPMREALQRLSYEGTLKIMPRCGIVIADINPVQQLKMLMVRRELERVIASSAAQNAGMAERQEFARLAETFTRAAEDLDRDAFTEADGTFNALITAVAQNEYAKHAVSPLRAEATRFWYLHLHRLGGIGLICNLHAAIAQAVAEGLPEAAGRASDRLMDYVEQYTREMLPG